MQEELTVDHIDTQKKDATLSLLESCRVSGILALDGIDRISSMLPESFLRTVAIRYRDLHADAVETARSMLEAQGKMGVGYTSVLEGDTWLSTEVKLAFRSSPETLASLLFDGANQTVRSLCQAMNRFTEAEPECRRLARRMIGTAEDFREEMKVYL